MADCSNPLNDLIGCTVTAVVGGPLGQFAEDLHKGANELWTGFFTSWIQSPLDGVIGGATAEWFTAISAPISAVLLALALMIAGIRMMLSARGDAAADAGRRLLRAILITVGGTVFFQVMLLGSNALSKMILETASNNTAPTLMGETATYAGNTAMALIFGLFLLIVVGIQWVLMVLRAVALTVLVPFWPVAASGAAFEKHEAMFEKVTGWLIAFLLYSPIAAALYGMAIKLREGRDGLEGVLIGMAIFLLALFALPALMRLVVPLSAAIGRANAAAMAGNSLRTFATTAVAVGAVVATAGAAAPAAASAGGGGAAATGGGAAGGSSAINATSSAGGGSGVDGAVGSGSARAAGDSGGQGPGGPAGSGDVAPASGASGSASGRSGWDTARDVTNGLPRGSSTEVGDTFDE